MLYFDIRNSKNFQLDLPQLPVFDYDDNTGGDGDDEVDDDINDSDISENSGEYHTDDQSSVGAANMDDD